MDYYKIVWKKLALKELKNIPREIIPQIISSIEKLQTNPYPHNVKKLKGTINTFRLRVGSYRVIYEIKNAKLIIQIVRIRHRKAAYKH